MKTKIYILATMILALIVLGTSCATQQERAQRKLAKAISLDPTILQSKTEIRDSVRIQDSVVVRDSVTITQKVETRIDFESPCDTVTGKIRPFNYESGSGPTYVRVWGDENGLHVSTKVDSLLQRNRELSQKSKIEQKKTEVMERTITVVKYKAIIWQVVAAGVFGFFVGLLPVIFKHVLSKRR